MKRPAVSVVMTAHNAAASIGPCLQSVAAQTEIPPGGFEIVLVDDRSKDGTSEAAKAALGDRVRLIRIDRPGDSGLTTRQDALARGFAEARGEVVLTLDADGIVPPDWVVAMTTPILEGKAEAVAGPVRFRAREGWLGVWQTVDVSYYLLLGKVLNAVGLPGGVLFGNFAFRTDLFSDIGGFGEIGFTLTEDLAFSRALKGQGADFLYTSKGAVEVEACPSWSVLVERAKRVSAGGVSALSITLGIWMASLPVIALLAWLTGGALLPLLYTRYAVGAAFAAFAVARVGKSAYLPAALLYEPMAIGIGLVVMARLAKGRQIEWGGQRYER